MHEREYARTHAALFSCQSLVDAKGPQTLPSPAKTRADSLAGPASFSLACVSFLLAVMHERMQDHHVVSMTWTAA